MWGDEMDHPVPACPVCAGPLTAVRLACDHCQVTVDGRFALPLASLSGELAVFAERFLRARGNLKAMERVTDLSYQALRARLDEVVAALGGEVEERRPSPGEAVLERLRAGEISAGEALALLRGESPPAPDQTDKEGDDVES